MSGDAGRVNSNAVDPPLIHGPVVTDSLPLGCGDAATYVVATRIAHYTPTFPAAECRGESMRVSTPLRSLTRDSHAIFAD